MATFIVYQVYEQHEQDIETLRQWRQRRPKQIDGLFVKVYPADHLNFGLYQADLAEWEFTWTRT